MGGKWKKHKAAEEARGQTEPPQASTPVVANGNHDTDMLLNVNGSDTPQALQADAPPSRASAPTVKHKARNFVSSAQTPPPSATAQRTAAGTHAPRATLGIAVPGSVIENATAEGAAAVAAQIARAAAIFAVDEVVVYDDKSSEASHNSTVASVSLATATLARLLQYLETPSYLRAALFPSSVAYPELRAAESLCPSLHTPHHQRSQAWQPYREGVVMRSEPGMGSFVDLGCDRNAYVNLDMPAGRRVTLHLGSAQHVEFVPAFSETMLKAEVVGPQEPCTRTGGYWGYSVRLAPSLHAAMKDGPGKGYDLIIGTSREGVAREVAELILPQYKHALVLFGGQQGLEEIFGRDEALAQAGKRPSDVCSLYLNCCPRQGVSEVRTEDAVTLCLTYLDASLAKFGGR